MTQAKTRITFEEYLRYDDGTDTRYELVGGEPVGSTNEQRDYRYKRSEYAARGIPEYWVVNPGERTITVFMLEHGLYEETVYTGEMVIQSRFEVLRLTPDRVFNRRR